MSHNGRALILPATLCLASTCFLSYEKASQKEPEKEIVEEVVSEAPPKSEFPFFHTLTDSQGRSIRAEVLGRDAYTVTIVRTRDKKRFTLSLDGLAPVDETFLRQLPITEPRPGDPVTVESPSHQRESQRKAIEEKKPRAMKNCCWAGSKRVTKKLRIFGRNCPTWIRIRFAQNPFPNAFRN